MYVSSTINGMSGVISVKSGTHNVIYYLEQNTEILLGITHKFNFNEGE